jgi:hypothetical protein
VKVDQLLEYRYKRRSQEEIERERSEPGYWRVDLRRQFNAQVRKYGGTVKGNERLSPTRINYVRLGGDIVILASGPSTMLNKRLRARGLMKSLARWIPELLKTHSVTAYYYNMPALARRLKEDDTPDQIYEWLVNGTGLEKLADASDAKDDGEKRPMVINLDLAIEKR